MKIAVAMVEYAFKNNMASQYPEPKDKLKFVEDQMYETDYETFLPDTYTWPENEVSSPQLTGGYNSKL